MQQKLEAQIAMERAKEKAMMEERMTRMEKLKKLREEKMAKEKEEKERTLKEKRKLHFDRAIEKFFIRINAMGKDGNHHRYWFFPREGRIFVESSDHSQWGFYTSKEELDGLIGSLNPKGVRERALQRQLDENYLRIWSASSDMGRRIFSFQEIMDSTNKFDESLLIGVGGFRKVYRGILQESTKVFVKRGNPRSEQGLAEFHAEKQNNVNWLTSSGSCAKCFAPVPLHFGPEKGRRESANQKKGCNSFQGGWRKDNTWYSRIT